MSLKKKKKEKRIFIGVSQSYIAYIELKQDHVLGLIHVIQSVLKRNLTPKNMHK